MKRTLKLALAAELKDKLETYLIGKYRFSCCYSDNWDLVETTRVRHSYWWCFLSFFMAYQYHINMIWDNFFTNVQSWANWIRIQNTWSWIQSNSVQRRWRVIIYVCDSIVEDLFGFVRRQHSADVEMSWRTWRTSPKRNDNNKQSGLKLESKESHL